MISSLTQITHSVVKDYFLEFKKSEQKKPLFILFPSKVNAGISLAMAMFKEFWSEELLTPQEIDVSVGSILEITPPKEENKRPRAVRVRCIRKQTPRITVIDKDNCEYSTHWESIKDIIRIVEGRPLAGNITGFRKACRALGKSKNTFSDILRTDDYINPDHLKSKIYFISGRSNVGRAHEFLNEKGLSEFAQVNKNLFIRQNLDDFQFYFNQHNQANNDNEFFKTVVADILNSYDGWDPDVDDLRNSVLLNLQENTFNTVSFRDQFCELIDKLRDNDFGCAESLKNQLDELITYDNNLRLDNIRCVFINSVALANLYLPTIRTLLINNLPVIIIEDRSNFSKKDVDDFRLFLKNFSDCYRLNWNRIKLHELNSEITPEYWDYLPYKSALRLRQQSININITGEIACDEIYYKLEIQRAFNIDGFEQLKADYYKYFRPIIYWYKNSIGNLAEALNSVITKSFEIFKNSFERVHEQLQHMNPELYYTLSTAISIYEDLIENRKIINDNKTNYFTQELLEFNGAEYLLDTDNKFSDFDDTFENITFTGIPYKEFKYFYLHKAIFETFIPQINLYAWPLEASGILPRLKSLFKLYEGLQDKLPKLNKTPHFTLKPQPEFIYLNINQEITEIDRPSEEYPDYQREMEDNYRYLKPYKQDDNDEKVEVVLELNPKGTVYLGRNTKIFTLDYNDNYEDLRFTDIYSGYRVFTYELTRRDSIFMRRDSIMGGYIRELDIWYDLLEKKYSEFEYDIKKLESYLDSVNKRDSIGGNPAEFNLRNWLNSRRIINAPDTKNLKLILIACGSQNNSELKDLMNEIYKAKKKVEKMDRENRTLIKSQIIKYGPNISTNSFTIEVNRRMSLEVFTGKVVEINTPDNLKVPSSEIGQIFNL